MRSVLPGRMHKRAQIVLGDLFTHACDMPLSCQSSVMGYIRVAKPSAHVT